MTGPTIADLQLGAPGVRFLSRRTDPVIRAVRMDAAGFAGIAPRGPIDTPVLVRSWSDYQRRFGGFEGPGLLPHAVAAFFAQGGERAHVVRVGTAAEHRFGPAEDPAVARCTGGPIELAAADPGAWGNRVTGELRLVPTALFAVLAPDADVPDRPTPAAPGCEIGAPLGVAVPPGSLLRVRTGPETVLRWVERIERREVEPGRQADVLVLDADVPRPDPDETGGAPVVASVMTAELLLRDADPDLPRDERHTGLGLHPAHPRYLPRVVEADSRLVVPIGSWTKARIAPTERVAFALAEGKDIASDVDTDSFFDDRDDVDPDDPDPDPLRGATGLAQLAELAMLVVPDLAWSAGTPADRVTVQARQRRLVQLADKARRFVVLLDVPPGMAVRDITRWRAFFDSSFAAAYHPWLRVDGTGPGRRALTVPPSAFAAGIIAARELRLGLPWGPANELATTAVGVTAVVSDTEHDQLHPLGVNVFRAERDGFRLTGARTLARDTAYRQLSVRRLMTMLQLALEREAQWVVFEPNTRAVREQLRHLLLAFLSGLYQAGAFAGADETEAFFVRVEDDLNPRASLDLGRLVVEVGVAPAEPLEFVVVRLVRDGAGGLGVEEVDRG